MICPESCGLLKPETTGEPVRTFTASELLGLNHNNGSNTPPQLYLRRMLSEINVNVTPDFSANNEYKNVRVDNVRYAVVNCPKSVYLHERVVPAGRDIPQDVFSNEETYKKYSANCDDWSEDGFYNTVEEAMFTQVDDGFYSKTNNHTFSFKYNRYENKHTGIAAQLKDYTDREAEEDGCFTALCPDGALYNNYAPYFVLLVDYELDKEDGSKPLYVTGRYVIHEGFANDYDGSKLDDSNTKEGTANYPTRLLDFSCIRNTKYTYKVTINGVNSILVQVEQSTAGAERNGVTGDVYTVLGSVVFDGDGMTKDDEDEYAFTLSNAARRAVADKWLIVAPWRAKTEDGEWVYKHVEYGYKGIVVPKFSTVLSLGDENIYLADNYTDNEANQFCNWIKFFYKDGTEIGNIAAFAAAEDIAEEEETVEHEYTLKVEPYSWQGAYEYAFDEEANSLTGSQTLDSWHNPEKDARALWLCTELKHKAGSSYENILSVIQNVKDERPKLPKPYVKEYTQPIYAFENVEVVFDVKDDGEHREHIDYYTVMAEDSSTELPFSESGSAYKFRESISCSYGDTKKLYAASYSDESAEYAASEYTEFEYMVFTKRQVWSLGAQPYSNISTSEMNYNDDWRPLSNTLEVRGSNIRQQLNDTGKDNGYIQIGAKSSPEAPDNTKSMFRLLIPESGCVHVRFTNTAANKGARYVAVYADGTEYVSKRTSSDATTYIDVYFNITLNEDKPTYVYVYSPESKNDGGLRYYMIEYNREFYYERTRWTWDFSKGEWPNLMNSIIDKESNSYEVSHDDLLVRAGNSTMKAGKNDNGYYYQMIGAGSTSARVFSFTADYTGTLKVTVSNTSDSQDNNRSVAVRIGSGQEVTQIGGFKGSEPGVLVYRIENITTTPQTVYIYPKGNGLRFYKIEFINDLDDDAELPPPSVETEPTVWDFSQAPWSTSQKMLDLIAKEGTAGYSGDTAFDLTLDGLHVFSGGGTLRAGKSGSVMYFQPANAGSMNSRCFTFTATTSGKVTVEASNTGSGQDDNRKVAVQTGSSTSNKESQAAGTPSNATHTFVTFDVNVSAPTQIYIYPEGGGLRFYRIEYSGGVQTN